MAAILTPDWKIHDVVDRLPESRRVIRAYGLDACCGGTLTLQQGAAAHELNLDAILAELQAVVDREEHGR